MLLLKPIKNIVDFLSQKGESLTLGAPTPGPTKCEGNIVDFLNDT